MEKVTDLMVRKYGDKQIIVAIEELSELIKELCKKSRGENNISNILEEIADCHIVLKEMQTYFHISDNQLQTQINRKLQRTRKRYVDVEMQVYERLCVGCPSAYKCHITCENCEDFEEEVKLVSNG